MDPPDQDPLIAIDCTRTYPADQYFACGQAQVRTFAALPPPAVVQALQQEGRQAVEDLDHLAAQGHFIPGAAALRQGIAHALNEGRLAWLRRALYSYPVRLCRQLLSTSP